MAAPVSVAPRFPRRRAFLHAARPEVDPALAHPKRHTVAGTLLLLYLAGITLTDRIIARITIPGVPIFAGEVVLAVGIIYLACRRRPFRGLRTGNWLAPMALALFLLWGLVEVVSSLNYSIIDVVRDSALVYYALFAVIAIGLAQYDSRFNPKELLRLYGELVPWLIVIAPIRIIGFTNFDRQGPTIPGTDVWIYSSHRLGNLGVHLGLAVVYLATSGRNDRKTTIAILASICMLIVIGSQNRGGLLAGGVAIGIAVVIWTRHVKLRLGWLLATAVFLVVVLWSFDVRITTQNRELSVTQLVTNFQAIGGNAEGNSQAEGTIDFRTDLWHAVLEKTVQTGQLENGWGFGPNLGSDFLPVGFDQQELRNPHNSHMTIIARLGLVGLGIWVVLWASWFVAVFGRARLAVRTRLFAADDTGRLALFALCGVAAILFNAYVDPTLESPMVAVWLWSMFGFGVIAVAADRSPAITGDSAPALG